MKFFELRVVLYQARSPPDLRHASGISIAWRHPILHPCFPAFGESRAEWVCGQWPQVPRCVATRAIKLIEATTNKTIPRTNPDTPATAQPPAAFPQNRNELPASGNARETPAVPCHPAASAPKPNRIETAEEIKKTLAFMETQITSKPGLSKRKFRQAVPTRVNQGAAGDGQARDSGLCQPVVMV